MRLIKYKSAYYDRNNSYYLDFSINHVHDPDYKLFGFNYHSLDSVEYWDGKGNVVGYYLDFGTGGIEFHI